MTRKKGIIILALVFVVVLAGAYLLYELRDPGAEPDRPASAAAPSQPPEAVGTPAPDESPSPPPEPREDGDAGSAEDGDTGNSASGGEEIPLAPDFTVYDVQGSAYRLSDFRGKPVVLNFWASWCGPCKSEMPDFDAAYAKYGEDVHFLMVNVTDNYQETLWSAAEFIGESGYSFPVYYDTDLSATSAYGVYSLPMTYFIDAEGGAVAYGMGAMSAEVLESGIAMIYSAE